ncbi:transporter substrate-binding protein [Bradyrhizobium sp. BR 1432]|uniref:transporter substrate-binding protein n=1 Tax=Bradyrhizobium sp. BR 1432 TaxID=3447966 RepID=UPI003EE7ADBD
MPARQPGRSCANTRRPTSDGSIYEGGACEQNIFCCNTEGNQQVVPLLEWSFKNLGKKLYYIASDYNAPRTFGAWESRDGQARRR